MIHNKGKSLTTSFPSIRFHANAEKLEELYASDDEASGEKQSTNDKTTLPTTTPSVEETSSSPLRTYLPKIIKKSSSIDVAPTDASPPSDRWKFFQEIKGKITKSVEEKLTEIKSRGQEEGSPKKGKDGKESSTVSDSEDLSESSISKTYGVTTTTTEEADMSSDEETPPPADTFIDAPSSSTPPQQDTIRQRLRFHSTKDNQDKLQSISDETEIASTEYAVDRGVEALEDVDFNLFDDEESNESIVEDVIEGENSRTITERIDNVEVDEDGVVKVKEVSGEEVRRSAALGENRVVFGPKGFVDLRGQCETEFRFPKFVTGISGFLLLYLIVQLHSAYFAGMMVGIAVTIAVMLVYFKFFHEELSNKEKPKQQDVVVEVQAVKEYQPIARYEGWLNEFPERYDPLTYHVSQTQTVFLRLQGNLLRVSHTRQKIQKRAVFNEHIHKPHFTYHRIYNLSGAKVSLLPVGLAKIRHWSKKYPICVTLSKDHMDFDYVPGLSKKYSKKDKQIDSISNATLLQRKTAPPPELLTQRFSNLTSKDEDGAINDANEDKAESKDNSAYSEDIFQTDETADEDAVSASLKEEWYNVTEGEAAAIQEELEQATRLYFFTRTSRDKEDWFRRFVKATHVNVAKSTKSTETTSDITEEQETSNTVLDDLKLEKEYLKTVLKYCKSNIFGPNSHIPQCNATDDSVLWLNSMLARVFFDFTRDPSINAKVRERIQRKLNSIKLPYFIEGITLTDLDLGTATPVVLKVHPPTIDDKGLWVDMEVRYEGNIVLALQTNLNLMKLKQHKEIDEQKRNEPQRLAMYHSDVDDTAESSTDDEGSSAYSGPISPLDSSGNPIQGLGGTSKRSKKFIQIVDKIADSKFFQAATDNKYIKNLMEGVSNTDLRLKVEIKSLDGILVLNLPPPPSDRLWMGFKPTPKLQVCAQPIVGERSITGMKVTGWIEKKMIQEFQKVLVLPNMEDIIVPVMCSKLPE